MFKRVLALCSCACLLAGCATPEPTLDPQLRPASSDRLVAALGSAAECAAPVVPKLNLTSSFKYGCFCGAGHPAVNAAAGEGLESLLARYYAIKPIDAVDEVCRDHDVCWAMRGEGDARCNRELYERLRYLGDRFETLGNGRAEGPFWRCRILVGDMGAAFATLFVNEKHETGASQFGSFLGKLVGTPVLVGTALVMRPLIYANDPYPLAGERCNLPPG
jgi:hypothetical protein